MSMDRSMINAKGSDVWLQRFRSYGGTIAISATAMLLAIAIGVAALGGGGYNLSEEEERYYDFKVAEWIISLEE